jgi:Tfp pilus assembly pilus retraction ATPase PilT
MKNEYHSITIGELEEKNPQHPGLKILIELVQVCYLAKVTDIHVPKEKDVKVRIEGEIRQLVGNSAERVLSYFTPGGQGFKHIRELLQFGATPSKTTVVRDPTNNFQIRCQFFQHEQNESITIRIQSTPPPDLMQILGRENTGLVTHLTNATGLVLVTGPIGAGKSTLAAAIAREWANHRRHVFTIEDPVEYDLSRTNGHVTQVSCTHKLTGIDGLFTFDEAIVHALRSDIDGLYIGETRSPTTLKTAMEFAGAREPVVTTFHAGSISDALVRAMTMATSVLDRDTAKLVLSQATHTILYVNLAYNGEGKPIPVVLSLPVGETSVKNVITEFDAKTIKSKIGDAMASGSQSRGFVNAAAAKRTAEAMGAKAATIEKALPPV